MIASCQRDQIVINRGKEKLRRSLIDSRNNDGFVC
jgi:hypothetical protein